MSEAREPVEEEEEEGGAWLGCEAAVDAAAAATAAAEATGITELWLILDVVMLVCCCPALRLDQPLSMAFVGLCWLVAAEARS